MITESIIITSIICATILCICFVIAYYSNKETNEQKLKSIRVVIDKFRDSYCKRNNDKHEYEYLGANKDIMNFISTIEGITIR